MSENKEAKKAIKAEARAAKAALKVAKSTKAKGAELPNPVWFKPVMFGFMLVGLLWILLFYISSAQLPLGAAFREAGLDIGNGNILVGFAIFLVGGAMATRWK